MDCMRDGFEEGKILDGRFLTLAPLNHGSFGMVFTAKDMLTGNDVAVKCITRAGAVDKSTTCPAAIATDERSEELAIHARLSTHSNIVNLIHHFETDAHQYMVLELCSNGDLYEAIRAGHGPLETEHVRSFMLELVDSIDHLHSHGVFHRDIKPENIFLTADGAMKLGDFGLATTETWSTEFAVGSDRYMAPEQFDSSVYGYGYAPAAADVWAIGIVLLNVLFQRNPFATPTAKDPLFADFVHDRQSLFDVFPNMSQDTFNVLVHSLALDPANRSLTAVREALKSALSFTTEEEALDEFCTEQNELVQVSTAAREPLRTPSVNSPNMAAESFPWTAALRQTPQKSVRQLSTIRDEPELFPGSVKSEWHYVDVDEASLSSNLDSGLGMSYKSSKSAKSAKSAVTKASSINFVGSLPISFTRPGRKLASPYGAHADGFSKSWSDLWDEEEEMGQVGLTPMELGLSIDRADTAKPLTPQLTAITEDDRGSVTPRQRIAEPHLVDERAASPLRRLVEHDRANPESPKQRSASILDKWAALGNFRRAKQVAETPKPEPVTSEVVAPTTSTSPRTKYYDAFASFTPFVSSAKKEKGQSKLHEGVAAASTSWRQASSPSRMRSTSLNNNSRVWNERRDNSSSAEPSPTGSGHQLQSPPRTAAAEAWALRKNWREPKEPSPPAPGTPSRIPATRAQEQTKPFTSELLILNNPNATKIPTSPNGDMNFLDSELADHDDIGDLEWVGGGWPDDDY